jgi:anti-sigma B factor antagonist
MRWTHITERFVEDVVILDLRGQGLQVDSENRLVGKIQRLLIAGRKKILLNLADLPYIENDGLGQIVNSYKAVRQADGTIKLCNVAEGLLDVLKASRIDSFLEAFESEDDAVQSFKA